MPLSADAKRGLNDLFFFANHYCGLTLEEKPHREMVRVIEEAELDPTKPYAMLVVPRGTYKTSIAQSAVVWKLLRHVHLHDDVSHRIVISSATLALGKASLGAIENIIRYGGLNGRIDEDYGSLWRNRDNDGPGSKMPDGLVIGPRIERRGEVFIKEPNVFVGSLRRISTGFHADEALVDDINNAENVSTDSQRKKTHDYWRLLFPIIGTKDNAGQPTKITMLATPWHDDDVRGMILREERERVTEGNYDSAWRILHKPAINEDGTPFFPSKYPLERLEELRRHMATRAFSANYLCDPVGDRGFVSEEEIKFRPADSFPPLKHGRICVDPNHHKEAKELGCYAAIVAGGYDRFAKLWVRGIWGSREWSTKQFIDELFRIQEQFPSWPIYIEDSHMAHFQHAIQLEEARRSDAEGAVVRLRIYWVPIDYKTSKYERWERLEPRFRTASIFFADDIPASMKVELKDELVRGQAARFKDFLDALALLETGYRPRIDSDGQHMEMVPPRVKGEKPVHTARDLMPDMFN